MSVLLTIIIAWGAIMLPHSPEGAPQLEAQMLKLYELAAKDINAMASRAFKELAENPSKRSAQFRQLRASQLAVLLERRMKRLGGEQKAILEPAARTAIHKAIQRGNEEMAKIGFDRKQILPSTQVSFININSEAVEVIAEDTLARTKSDIEISLQDGIRKHAASAKSIFRSLSQSQLTINNPLAEVEVNRAIARGLITGNSKLADRLIRELYQPAGQEPLSVRKLGNQIIEVGKASMTVRQYAMTVTRTRMREATVTARHRQLQSRGMQLVQITGSNSENFCTAFNGLVCSLDGSTTHEDFAGPIVPLESLPGGGPPFHPNCSKSTAPFSPRLASSERLAMATHAHRVYTTRARQGKLLKPFR